MKKLIVMILAAIIMVALTTSAFADTSAHTESAEFVADQTTLDALYQKHLSLRSNTAKLTEKQADLLRAMGIEDDKISVITNGEVADLLKTGEIANPEYIMKYVDEEALILDAIESKAKIEQMLMDRGLNKDQIKAFIENGLVPWHYEDDDNSKLLRDLERLSSSITPMSSSCHVFVGTRSTNLLNEDDVHFHSSSFVTSMYYQGQNITLPKKPTEGTLAYTLKCNTLASHLYDISKMSLKLYNRSNTTGTIYNEYLWCEEHVNGTDMFHEGVDVNRGFGASLYSIADGSVILKTTGSTSVVSKLLVYNETLDVTIQYLHGNWSSAPSSGSITQSQKIGTEDKRGASGYHTHIQIMDGEETYVPLENNIIDSLKPYYYFLYWC